MYARRNLRLGHILNDSWLYLVLMGIWSTFVVYAHEILGYKQIDVPILPVTMIGVAVSLYLGFKSTQAYARWWEARKIWGAIINNSRSWSNHVISLVYDENNKADKAIHQDLIYRHLAWVNALVYQLVYV